MRILMLILALSLQGLLARPAAAFDAGHAAWTALLTQHVRWINQGTASQVDYAGFARDRAALKAYLDTLSAVSASEYERWSLQDRQAFLINAYNAYTIELVLTRWPALESIKDLGGWFSSPWKQRYFQLLGAERSLDEVEHDLIRGARGFDEPRIHFAVNCASIGCPALRPEAYVGARLDAQLDDQTRRFLRDRTRNRYEAAGSVMRISKLFDWYASDFNDATVFDFLTRYADDLTDDPTAERKLRIGAIDLEYSEYDWRLNGVR